MFGFVDALLDLSNLFGHGNLLGTDLCALPQGLATPGPILVTQKGDPFFRTLIPGIKEIAEGPYERCGPDVFLRLFLLVDGAG